MRFFLSIALCGVLLFCSCAREPGMRSRVSRVSDSLYMARAAMKVYGMEPERALTIIDSALITGNVSPFQADFLRAKVYANLYLQRQDIVERFDIPRHALNQLLSAYAEGMSFTAYINKIRLTSGNCSSTSMA